MVSAQWPAQADLGALSPSFLLDHCLHFQLLGFLSSHTPHSHNIISKLQPKDDCCLPTRIEIVLALKASLCQL